MRLTFWGWVATGLFTTWLIVAGSIVYVDSQLRRQDRQRLQTREWQEKVDAMRRLQDIEGDA